MPAARGSSGWALQRRDWIRVQGGGLMTERAMGAINCGANMSFGILKVNLVAFRGRKLVFTNEKKTALLRQMRIRPT